MSNRFKPSPETEHKTEVIVHMMHGTPVGGMLTYQAMRERLNEPVTSQHAALKAALDAAKDEGMCFWNVPGEGYKRLSDGETAETGISKHVKKVFRAAKRGLRTASSIRNIASLTREQRTHLWAKRAVLETIKTSTHGNSINGRIGKAEQGPTALDKELQKLSAKPEQVSEGVG